MSQRTHAFGAYVIRIERRLSRFLYLSVNFVFFVVVVAAAAVVWFLSIDIGDAATYLAIPSAHMVYNYNNTHSMRTHRKLKILSSLESMEMIDH